MRSIAKFVGGLVLALVALGVVFVVGMRTKSPPVLNTVRGSAERRRVRVELGRHCW